MAKRIYVGNLPYSLTKEDVVELFSAYGEVDIKETRLLEDRETNRSRGIAFVDMPNDEEALKAIEELSGREVEGRNIVVNEARPREDRPAFGGSNRGGGSFGGGRSGGSRGGDRGGFGGGRSNRF